MFGQAHETQASLIAHQMESSEAGQVLQMAIDTPAFFRTATLLFPRKLRSLMPDLEDELSIKAKKELFKRLDNMIVNKPWHLGFGSV